MRNLLLITSCILIGFLIGMSAARIFKKTSQDRFDEAMDSMFNHASPRVDDNGLTSVDAKDVSVPLAELVRDGKLYHAIIVLPSVPKTSATTKIWMEEVNSADELVWAEGLGEFEGISPGGTPVQGFNFWYKPGSVSIVQKVVEKIEAYHQQADSKGAQLHGASDL